MNITLGEVVTPAQCKTGKYDGIIDVHKSEIPHVNILMLQMEGLEIEYNGGRTQNLHLVMSRLYMKDLQKVQERRAGELVVRNLIPDCYQMILSNPDIEKEYDESSSHFSMNAKSVRTEDFLSMRDADNESVTNAADTASSMSQLRLSLLMENQTTNVDFMFTNLRLVGKYLGLTW